MNIQRAQGTDAGTDAAGTDVNYRKKICFDPWRKENRTVAVVN